MDNSIKLLVARSAGVPSYESVPAELIEGSVYRILASPGFAPGVASGDIIELDERERGGYRIRKRSGNLAVQVFFNPTACFDRSPAVKAVTEIGGWLDGG